MSQNSSKELSRFAMLNILHQAQEHTLIPLLVTSMSMLPFLFHKRSVVFLEKDSAYVPKKGDIVFFLRADTTPILHRIVKVKKDGTLVIKGDAQRWREEIQPYQILAHVTYIQRKRRRFSVRNKFYRLMVGLWMPFRLIHPPVAYCIHLLNRVPFKLSRKYRERNS